LIAIMSRERPHGNKTQMPAALREDSAEAAARWALAQPQLRQLMCDSYVSHDPVSDAMRFSSSAEFAETLALLTKYGRGPGQAYALLDFGCGNGIASYAFSRAGYQVSATDLCRGATAGLGAARRLIGRNGCDFAILEDDALSILAPGSMDVIYCRQVLHHLRPLQGSVLNKLIAALRPGGVFCGIREQVIWSEAQRERLWHEHPLNHITQDEDGYYLQQYRTALNSGGLSLRDTLWPLDSVINLFPLEVTTLEQQFRERLPIAGPLLLRYPATRRAALRSVAYLRRQRPPWQLFSFIAVKRSAAALASGGKLQNRGLACI
jgi:SAM-dependent methyltransferase